MKRLIFICIFLIVYGSADGQPAHVFLHDSAAFKISPLEKQIINDFLETELQKQKYIPYRDRTCVIEEALSELSPLIFYEASYQWKDRPVRISTNEEWLLNLKQVEQLKAVYANRQKYQWTSFDFSGFDPIMIEPALFDNIKKGPKTIFYKSMIIRLSRPLIVDENHAFVSYVCVGNLVSFQYLENCAVLLKRHNGKWLIDSVYHMGDS